ncbi:hypothetical protein JTB14_028846 [Gonioctena quinquepunctata]|nr:hypothetical protein JTB14_028846 [Gonioctena quinquepunctata]
MMPIIKNYFTSDKPMDSTIAEVEYKLDHKHSQIMETINILMNTVKQSHVEINKCYEEIKHQGKTSCGLDEMKLQTALNTHCTNVVKKDMEAMLNKIEKKKRNKRKILLEKTVMTLNRQLGKIDALENEIILLKKKQHISETCREEEQDYDKTLKSTPSRSNRTTVTTMEPGLSSASSKDYLKKQQSKLVEEYENKMQDIINLQTEGSKRLESAKTNQSENNYKNADRTPKTTYYNGREERKSRYTRKYGPV